MPGVTERLPLPKPLDSRAVLRHLIVEAMQSVQNDLALQAAQDLYGAVSAPYNAVRDAWTAVGVN
jgi:Zn-dependent metalloprotease